jgi:uncharacterized protein YfiM (DUF2279 family)
MRRLRRWLLLLLLLPLALLAAAALLAFEREPLVDRGEAISPGAVLQARALFRANDPRKLRPGEQRTVTVPLALLDEGINHLASRGLHGHGAAVIAGPGAGEVRLSRRLPGSWYANLRATIAATDDGPRIIGASLGKLPLPARLANAMIDSGADAAGYGREWILVRQAIRGLAFDSAAGAVAVTYVWAPEILARARSLALPAADVEYLRTGQARLADLLGRARVDTKLPLTDILAPLLAATGEDRSLQRRAALLVLAIYLAEKDLAALTPAARSWPHLPPRELTMNGRHDTAQHFVVSAALAAWAGEPIADAIGLSKEIDDARQGSGFSFADLAADRAGTRFGELVARQSARLDEALRLALDDKILIPSQEGLPEYLHEPEFRRRYGGPGQPAYRRLEEEINHRLDALALYR